MATAKISEPMDGDKAYQERARAALPLLVRQAEAGNTIYYSDLANELGMPNPRNLNYVLGSIGQTLENLSERWGHEVPPIQALVINRTKNMPGEGIGWFIDKKSDYRQLSPGKKRKLFKSALRRVFDYPHWERVLQTLNLGVAHAVLVPVTARSFASGGEGEAHKALKNYVASHPELLGLPSTTPRGEMEYFLRSGDALDVSFRTKTVWVAAEVKARSSNDEDVQRGIFQCVKYNAVMKAEEVLEGMPRDVRVVLVLENELPKWLLPAKHTLDIDVKENVKTKNKGGV